MLTRKTKANLYKGLIELMQEKEFEDIKVIDICKKSLINRSTFYDHFNDKFELCWWEKSAYQLTEAEIKAIDERFWPFAVPVEEVVEG